MAILYSRLTRPSSFMRRVFTQSTFADVVTFLMQRLPFTGHVLMLVLCAIGPIYTPVLLAFCLVSVHIIFACCQLRTAYALFSAWRGVKAHSQRDWVEWFNHQRSTMEACDSAHHVLNLEDVQHVIIVPAYKEDVATLRETLDILASHPMARSSYYVCLGMEEREEGSNIKAQMLCDAYRAKGKFVDLTYSIHPGNIVGESAGKSSNVNWAARQMAKRRGISSLRAVYTVMDADTGFAADYFLACSAHFALSKPAIRQRMMFVPTILFDRNSPEVPVFVRLTDIFWACAGMSGTYPTSTVKIPTSAYGVSMELARFCDYWDAGPEAIGEDMHFYAKAMFETKGNIHPITVYSPASQCNVVGKQGSTAFRSYMIDLEARWTQAVRHMWGSLDFGYCCSRIILARYGRSAPREDYVAVRTSSSQSRDDEDDDDRTYVDSEGRSVSDYASSSRTASPSVTATTDVSEDAEFSKFSIARPSRKHSQIDEPYHANVTENGRLGLPTVPINILNEHSTHNGKPHVALFNDDAEIEAQVQDTYDEQSEREKMRIFPFFVLMSRLYEAHFMIAQVTLMGLLVKIYPSVVYRNGTVAFFDPYNRSCTMSDCFVSLFQSPFAAGVDLPADTAPGLHPSWMMPTIVTCALNASQILGAIAVLSTAVALVFHDCYHHAASKRWATSDLLYREWSVAQRNAYDMAEHDRFRSAAGGAPTSPPVRRPMPGRYLGMRAHQTCQRKWPKAILDFAALPAMLMYGIAPLLWAQAHHLFTNKLTYTVSAKSKQVVIVPTINASRASVDRLRGPSMDLARLMTDEKDMA